ncbi:MAG: MFS transporter [Chloroflexi bacterium]|nr:MFS transporter [Chloroflexota bacterium]
MEQWKKNLYAVTLAQTLVAMGFSFVFPFIPLYIQELGIKDPRDAAFWAGLAGGAMGFSLFFSGPIWGSLSDRHGRKLMLVRSYLGGALCLMLLGLATNVYHVVLLRFLQGATAGSMSAAMALVAAATPKQKMGYSMGLIQMAFFGGSTFGPFIGGALADAIGYRPTFFLTGAFFALSTFLILLLVEEQREPAPKATAGKRLGFFQDVWKIAGSKAVLPFLMVLLLVQGAPNLIQPVLSVFVQFLTKGGLVATTAGLAFSLMGLTAAATAALVGQVSDRLNLKTTLIMCCFASAIFYLPMFFIQSVPPFLVLMAVIGLFKGGMLTCASALIGNAVPRGRHGAAYGAVQSVNALAFGVSPLVGGALAVVLGIRSVFIFTSLAFLAIGIATLKIFGGARATEDKETKQEMAKL